MTIDEELLKLLEEDYKLFQRLLILNRHDFALRNKIQNSIHLIYLTKKKVEDERKNITKFGMEKIGK